MIAAITTEEGLSASFPCHPTCKRCGGLMSPSVAMQQTFTSGSPDFPGDLTGITLSPGGPGKLIECLKCDKCGWSVTQ